MKFIKGIDIKAFNIRTLVQIGQQVSLAITQDSPNADICCVSETWFLNSSAVLQRCWNSDNKCFLILSLEDTAEAAGFAGDGFVLSNRAQRAFIDWFLVITC